jgi:curli production assembly/transport component CsgF
MFAVGVLGLFMTADAVHASELVYRPINPSFGGDPFNSNHLLGIANSINKFEDPKANDRFRPDPQEDFAQVIQSSILSRVASQIADQIYGENARTSGTATVGGTTIQWAQVNGQIRLVLNNGKSTQTIELPAY